MESIKSNSINKTRWKNMWSVNPTQRSGETSLKLTERESKMGINIIKEQIIADIKKLTNQDLAKIYKFIRREIISDIPDRKSKVNLSHVSLVMSSLLDAEIETFENDKALTDEVKTELRLSVQRIRQSAISYQEIK